mgnify:FL=1
MEFLLSHYQEISLICFSYLLGCLSTGYYLTLFRTGKDIRTLGSKSTTSSNVYRVLGTKGFLFTLAIDFAKGALVVATAVFLQMESWTTILSMIGVILGQTFPINLRFRGGKGLGTAGGALLIFNYWMFITMCALALILYVITKRLTHSSLAIIAISPVLAVALGHSTLNVTGFTFIALIILVAHRDNIRHIIKNLTRNK